MKHELTNYKALFPGIFTPYAEDGVVYFECNSCGKKPAEETRSDLGLATQVYMVCPCYAGNYSYPTAILVEMKESLV